MATTKPNTSSAACGAEPNRGLDADILQSVIALKSRAEAISKLAAGLQERATKSSLAKLENGNDTMRTKARVKNASLALHAATRMLGDLLNGRAAWAPPQPLARPMPPVQCGLPAEVRDAVRKVQFDLPPLQARQLDSLVRKRLGVHDPVPESTSDAESRVVDLADAIARAAVADEIRKVHSGAAK